MWFLYMLRLEDDSLYTGITTDVKRRLKQHREDEGSKYVRSRLPLEIVYKEKVGSKSEALQREAEEKMKEKEKLGERLNKKRRKVVSEAIGDFARYKGCEEVVYYGNPFNNASNQFYQNLKENKYEEVNGKSIDIESAKDLHIEADLDDLGGKRIGLD